MPITHRISLWARILIAPCKIKKSFISAHGNAVGKYTVLRKSLAETQLDFDRIATLCQKNLGVQDMRERKSTLSSGEEVLTIP